MDRAVVRDDMVDGLAHESKGVLESDALAVALRDVPRHEFVDDDRSAYADREHERLGTRVLAPSTVVRLLEALDLDAEFESDSHSDLRAADTVLVVGAGVGYTAAVIAEIVGETGVHAVDIARPVVYDARQNLARAGYDGVLVDCRDGARGLPEYAPFDRILVEAAAVEPPPALLEQLADGGRLVFPRIREGHQRIEAVDADGGRDSFDAVALGPLLVEGEQSGAIERNRTEREDSERARRRSESRRGWELEWIEWE